MPPPSGLLGRMQEAAANASARSTARQAMETERLRRATEALNTANSRANEIAREHARLLREGDHAGAQQASQAYERQIRRENAALEERNQILEQQRGMSERLARSAGQRLSSGIGNQTVATIQRMRGQIERAHHALLQNTRDFSDVTTTGLANAISGYTGALAHAIDIGIKYGQSVDELTQIQHSLVEAMNTDVHHGGWTESVDAITEDFAAIASRSGRAVADVAQAQLEMSRTFGRGSQAEVEAFASQMTRVSMIPEVLRQRLEAAGQQVGMVFNNREMAIMIEQWTEQFGDQAMSIEEMSANMMNFRRQATEAGHSVRSINAMNAAFAAGTIGRHGTDVNTVRAGQQLSARFASDEEFRNRVLGNMRRPDGTVNTTDQTITTQIAADAAGGNALAASDLYHMLQGTTEGVQAITDSMVGFYDQPLWKATRMMQQQGFDTGTEANNQRLAFLLQQRHATGDDSGNAEIQQLLTEAGQRSAEQERAQADQYTNVAIAAHAAEYGAELLAEVVQNTSGGGAIVAGLAGVAAVMAHAFPSLGNEWRDLFNGQVTIDERATTATTTQMTAARMAGRSVGDARAQLQNWYDAQQQGDFDPESDSGRERIRALLAHSRRNLSDAEFRDVMNKMEDVGFVGSGAERAAMEANAEDAARSIERRQATSNIPTLEATEAARRAREAATAEAARNASVRATVPTTPNRADTANQVIQQGATPASTPASAPTPAPARAPATPTPAPTNTRGASLTQVGPARGRLAANGNLEVPTVLRIENFVALSAEADARNAATAPFGVPT